MYLGTLDAFIFCNKVSKSIFQKSKKKKENKNKTENKKTKTFLLLGTYVSADPLLLEVSLIGEDTEWNLQKAPVGNNNTDS